MRWTSRSTQGRAPTIASQHVDEALHVGDQSVPTKAELLLGTQTRLGRGNVNNERDGTRGGRAVTFQHVQSAEQKNLGTLLRAQEELLDSQESLLESMPDDRSPKLKVWPDVEKTNRSALDVTSLSVNQPTGRSGLTTPPRHTSPNATHAGYDAARQPLAVSPQTSMSAVRDMGLRKGAAIAMHETASDPTLSHRPLKSVLNKQPSILTIRTQSTMASSSSYNPERQPRSESSQKTSRRLDLSRFFPQPTSSSRNVLSPKSLSRSPSVLTESSDYLSRETVHVKLQRPATNTRFEPQRTANPPSVNSDDTTRANSTTRAKVFEPDMYDPAKRNVRRPPKGIQNWFDGFDISSDEEEQGAIALPPRQEPQELPANEEPTVEALPSTFSPWDLKPESEQPRLSQTSRRKSSRDPVEDNMLAIEHAKERLQERMRLAAARRNGSGDSGTLGSIVSSHAHGRRRGGESRMAMSELASQSVLSLSESDEEKKASRPGQVDIPPTIDNPRTRQEPLARVEEVLATPRKDASVQKKRNRPNDMMIRQPGADPEYFPRQSSTTVRSTETSGSIPIRLTDWEPPLPTEGNRHTQTSQSDPTAVALRKLTGQRESGATPQSQRTRALSRPNTGKESVASGEMASSPLTEAAHIMAVTEEEMMLLEMMRNKRAAMQKNSFTEGYQLALKREQGHLAPRRGGPQQIASKMLRAKEEKAAAKGGANKGGSNMSSIAGGAAAAAEEGVADGHRRKYSALRKEDVDKRLTVERYFANAEAPSVEHFFEFPLVDHFPTPPTSRKNSAVPAEEISAVAAPAPAAAAVMKRPRQKFDLLLPTAYSPTPSKAEDASPISIGDSLGEDDIEDHHDAVKQFLASPRASEFPRSARDSILPTSSPAKSLVDVRRELSLRSVTLVEEENKRTPDVPAWNLDHVASPVSALSDGMTSIDDRRLSCHTVDLSLDIPSAVPAPPKQAAQTAHSNLYNLTPNFDFTSLDYVARQQLTASPSPSSIRASPRSKTFTPTTAPTSEKPATEGAYSSDCASSIRGRRVYTPDTDLASLMSTSSGRKRGAVAKMVPPKRVMPPKLDIAVNHHARGSVGSITSAGEDVLAAWAELGGGSEARRLRVDGGY